MEIRPFEETDRQPLERLMDDFQDELVAMDPYRRLIRAEGYGAWAVDKMLRVASDGTVLVALDGGRIIGFASGIVQERPEEEELEIVPFRNGVIPELYVAPDARERGIGTALVERFETSFRERGCGAIAINVFAPNTGARAFYEGLGYEERDIWVYKKFD